VEGNKAYNEKRYTAAQEQFAKAAEADSVQISYAYNLGNAYYKQNQLDKAIEQYDRVIDLEKENSMRLSATFHNKGDALLKQKKLPEAAEAFKNALRNNPKDQQARYNLAVVQKLMQQQQQQNQPQPQPQNQDQQQNQQQEKQQPQQPQMSKQAMEQILEQMKQEEKATLDKMRQKQPAQQPNNDKDW
jgi:tetratricopeptide (TPR) repeat protein